MALDLTAAQNSILEYLRDTLPQFTYIEGPETENEQFWKDIDVELPPTMLVYFGKLRSSGRGKAVAGARHDDYTTWMDVVCAGSFYPSVREALNLVTDYLTGFRPAAATPLVPDGGTSDQLTRSFAVRPTIYLDSQRFAYGVNITPSAPPQPPGP